MPENGCQSALQAEMTFRAIRQDGRGNPAFYWRKMMKDRTQNAGAKNFLQILKNSAYAMTLLDELSGKCSKLILSDVVTGAALLAASANGGFINVGANTGLMKNTEIAQKLNEEAKMLLSQTMKLHDSISQLML